MMTVLFTGLLKRETEKLQLFENSAPSAVIVQNPEKRAQCSTLPVACAAIRKSRAG